MKPVRMNKNQRALAAKEMLVAMVVVAAIVGIILPAFISPRTRGLPRTAQMQCVNNLKQVGLAFRIYANDHADLFPLQVAEREGGALESIERADVSRIFLSMSNELSVPKTVICPADSRVAAASWIAFGNTNISYFVSVDGEGGYPNMILSGDRNLERGGSLLSGLTVLSANAPTTWTSALHQNAGNFGLVDGSVVQTSARTLRRQSHSGASNTNRFLFPNQKGVQNAKISSVVRSKTGRRRNEIRRNSVVARLGSRWKITHKFPVKLS